MALKTSHIRWLGKYESFLWIITPIPSRRENNAANITAYVPSMYGIYSTLIYKKPLPRTGNQITLQYLVKQSRGYHLAQT